MTTNAQRRVRDGLDGLTDEALAARYGGQIGQTVEGVQRDVRHGRLTRQAMTDAIVAHEAPKAPKAVSRKAAKAPKAKP